MSQKLRVRFHGETPTVVLGFGEVTPGEITEAVCEDELAARLRNDARFEVVVEEKPRAAKPRAAAKSDAAPESPAAAPETAAADGDVSASAGAR